MALSATLMGAPEHAEAVMPILNCHTSGGMISAAQYALILSFTSTIPHAGAAVVANENFYDI